MPRISEDTKAERQERLLLELRRHPGGLSEAELAALLGLERRTINNYLRELELRGQLYKEEMLWLVDPHSESYRLRHLTISPEQAMTLYLAVRLLVKQHDKRHESAETALLKLAEALTEEWGVGDEIRQAARELAERPGDQSYSRVFREVVRGYVYRRAIRINYVPRHRRPFQATLYPYLLEPSAIGFTTYVIGHGDPPGDLRTYKLERITEAILTDEQYSIPPDFPGLEILRHAWSIIHGEELIEVVLRFHPSVVDRVLETRWHPSERKEHDPDNPGFLLWGAQVADTTDMLPWIRGWGADCEVLAPPELRDTITGEAARLARMYGVQAHQSDGSVDYDATFQEFFGDET